jgi:RES domain-containing protein
VIVSAWRVVKASKVDAAFTGQGARKYGGRWNSPGVAVVYTAQSVSLAMLEILVHVQSRKLLKNYVLFEVTFDEALIAEVAIEDLPATWHRSPASGKGQGVGDAWISRADSAVLKLPSVVVPTEFNYLLNPAHSDFSKLTIGKPQPVEFDDRLSK